jgi:two-component system, cell cycle sensor histidine kinase and response regulator CckA
MRTEITYPLSRRSAATRLALGFVIWSTIWVVISDYLVNLLISPKKFWSLQTEKGLIYIAVSGLLLWLSVRAIELEEKRRRALNESKLQRLKESGLIGVAGRTPSGRLDYVNETFAQMLGYNYHELIGMEASKFIPSSYHHLKEQLEIQLHEFGRTPLLEFELIRKDGSRMPTLGGRAKLADANGGEICYFVDITQLRRSEKERQQLHEQLLQSEKINAVGQLAGSIAHDFNNELAIIIGYASLLEERLSQDEVSRSNTSLILKSAERARKLIRQLLTFSRKQKQRVEVIDLNHALRETDSMLRPLLNKNIELRVHLSDEEEFVEIDPSQFHQVTINLAVNARDAMPNGGVLAIELGHSSVNRDLNESGTAQSVVVKITDTGMGIPDSIQPRVFEPFFTTKEQSGGSGLGLAVVHGIVKQSNGEISLMSKPGQGTCFVLKFPRVERKRGQEMPALTLSPCSLSGTVLLAEDLDDLREMMVHILTQKGLQVFAASDGINAVRIANETQGSIDLIIADVAMPRMNGPDAVRRIRELRPGVKVMYLSGYAESFMPEEGDLLMTKPVTPEALVQAIHNCLTNDVRPEKPAQNRHFAA